MIKATHSSGIWKKVAKMALKHRNIASGTKIVTIFAARKTKKREKIMATAIKAIPTLEGKEAEEFLRRAEEAEKNYIIESEYEHPFCVMAHEILAKAGMA